MKSDIVTFVSSVKSLFNKFDENRANLQKMKVDVLGKFDRWREKEKPEILSVTWGNNLVHDSYGEVMWWVEVFYLKKSPK